MLKIRLLGVLKTSLLAICLSAIGVVGAFDADGARQAIDSFKQALASAQITGVGDALTALDAQVSDAAQSGYALDAALADVIAKSQADIDELKFVLFMPPSSSDVDALESAYSAYVGGVESLRLQDVLTSLEADSEQALVEADALVQQLLDAFKEAQGFVVDSNSSNQPVVS